MDCEEQKKMADCAAEMPFSPVESSLHNHVQVLLKEMTSQSVAQKELKQSFVDWCQENRLHWTTAHEGPEQTGPAQEAEVQRVQRVLLKNFYDSWWHQPAQQTGILWWSLQEKLQSNPSCSVPLIQVLVKELEKKQRSLSKMCKTQSYVQIIPVVQTVYYVIIQSGAMIPPSLYETVCECLMKLLVLPLPYSAVALSTLRSIKMEMSTPGSLYHRRVTAEQNLRNEHFTLQEKVFVLADPAVFSVPLEATVRSCMEVPGRRTSTMEKNVVLRVLQTGLKRSCQSPRLVQALEALGDRMVEKFFQEVVLAVEQNIKLGADGHENYVNKLHNIYRDILSAPKDEITIIDHGFASGISMPSPDINFIMWRYDEDLWNLLANFALHCFPHTSVDKDSKDKQDSFWSRSSEIDRRRSASVDDTEQPTVRKHSSVLNRRKAFKNLKLADKVDLMREKMEAFPGSFPALKEERRRHTARVVVMGDDRVLGRLTRAFHGIRERESRHLILTKKLNLQLYYIPVTDVEPSLSPPDSSCLDEGRLSLASVLGRVDPWYDSNINSLGAAVSKLAGVLSNNIKPPQQNFPLLETLCYYLRCATQPVNLPLYSVKMTCSKGDMSPVVEEVFVSHLEAHIPEFRHLKQKSTKGPSTRRRRPTVEIFGAVISVSYTKISLSKREVVKGVAPMTYGVVITPEQGVVTSGENYLNVRFDSMNTGDNTQIQTQIITIRTLEQRSLSVCLDKDSRRTYTDVHRIEISPCLDPGCSTRSRFSISNERELPLSKYLDKVLSLPINTFSGVTL